MSGEIVITFSTTSRSIAADNLLNNNAVPYSVMPLPGSIGAGCGICVRIKEENLDKTLSLFKKDKLEYEGLYEKLASDKTGCYQKLQL